MSPETIDQKFFTALTHSDLQTLERIVAPDFVLVDVMTGSEVTKAAFLDVLRQGALKFDKIDRVEFHVRFYGSTAVIVGRTQMSGIYAGHPFTAASRYTHVFAGENGEWRLVSAQGTQIQ
jgi:ketosteroid isomerase-like protein